MRQTRLPFRSVLGGDYVDCGEVRVLRRTVKAVQVAFVSYAVMPAWVPLSVMSPECELHAREDGILEARLWWAQKLKLWGRDRRPNTDLLRRTPE